MGTLYSGAMLATIQVQGRAVSELDLEWIGQWLSDHPTWSRCRLSQELATHWGWRNAAGQLKDMAARTLLAKLEQRGLIRLPARRQVPSKRMRCAESPLELRTATPAPIEVGLKQLGRLRVEEVSRHRAERAWLRQALEQYHYLGFNGPVGQNLQYVVRDEQERPLAGLVFGAAAWKCQDRDQFIGWTAAQRQAQLPWIANNSRFLILPWVRVPQLGSWVLGRVTQRIAADWQAKYGQAVALLETFVECARFRATVYRAANWQAVGVTTGRTRQDRHSNLEVPVKAIYLYPLQRNFREVLCS